jgi:hypothetical protein
MKAVPFNAGGNINLLDAQADIVKWHDEAAKWGDTPDWLKAFHGCLIPKEDLTGLASLIDPDPNVLGVRAYIGFGDCPISFESDVVVTVKAPKLIFVVVNKSLQPGETTDFGKDILTDSREPDQSQIFDFTSPCPPCCDPDSQLLFKNIDV